MDYSIQIAVNQAAGPPRVVNESIERGLPREEAVIMTAKAYLKTAPVEGKIIAHDGGPSIDLAVVGTDAVFVQVFKLEDGAPTGPAIFSITLAELG